MVNGKQNPPGVNPADFDSQPDQTAAPCVSRAIDRASGKPNMS
jgi:hypothetical protein